MDKIKEYEAYKKFRDALMKISVSSTYEDACKEWEAVGSDSPESEQGCCICGVLIENHFYFRNMITDETHTFGSVCVKKYSTDLSNALGKAIESESGLIDAVNTLKKLIKAMWWYGCSPVSVEKLCILDAQYLHLDNYSALLTYKDKYDGIPVRLMSDKYGKKYIELIKELCTKYRLLESRVNFKTELKDWKPSEKRLGMIKENFDYQKSKNSWMIKTNL